MFQLHEARLGQFLCEVEERRRAVVAFGERGVELQQRALEKTRLRGDLTIRQNLQRTANNWKRLRKRRRGHGRCRRTSTPGGRRLSDQVFVRDELVTVTLQDDARKRSTA